MKSVVRVFDQNRMLLF